MPTYRIDDFLRTADIYIAPEIQNREHYPFTMHNAQRFFHQFRGIPFELNATARALFIFRGKEALPRSSFAEGALYSQNVDELEAHAQRNYGNLPEPIGAILFECGGTRVEPYIKVNGNHGFVWTSDHRRFATSSTETPLKFNGLYFCDFMNSHGTNRYLRFYEDGEVIWCLSTGKPGNVVRWFHKNHAATTTKGHYQLQGRNIQFDLSSTPPDTWTNTLSGQVSGDVLELIDQIGLPYLYEFFPDDALTNCTQLLGIEGELTEDGVKNAYRTMIAKYHPDKVQHLGDEFRQMAAQKAQEINEAYDFICKHYSFHD